MSKGDIDRPHVDISETEVEGMMSGVWREDTERSLSDTHTAVCLDGTVWKVIDEGENVLGFVNPTNCITSVELRRGFEQVIQTGL